MYFNCRDRKGDQDEVRLINSSLLIFKFQVYFSILKIRYSGDALFYDLQMAFLASIFANNLLCILSNLGQVFSTRLIDLSYAIYQSEWYRYPRDVRRLVQLMIMKSQQPFDSALWL